MVQDLSLNQLRELAERAALKLPDDELAKLLPGVNRARRQADELRQLVNAQTEPAGHFGADKGN